MSDTKINETIKTAIKDYMVNNKHMFLDIEAGTIEYYRDYRDNLDNFPFDKCETLEEFEEVIYSWYNDLGYDCYKEIIEALELDEVFVDENLDTIRDILQEMICFVAPDYTQDLIKVDLFYKGYTKSDYLCEVSDITYFSDMFVLDKDTKKILSSRSLKTLPKSLSDFMKNFGYSKKKFVEYIRDARNYAKYQNSFIKEVYDELLECYGNNIIAMCGEMTVKDYFLFKEAIAKKDPSVKIKLSTNTYFTFFDRMNGSGTDSIYLPKEVILPATVFYDINEKDSYKYSIDSVYGLIGDVWTKSPFTLINKE